jgi:hypothetical protein
MGNFFMGKTIFIDARNGDAVKTMTVALTKEVLPDVA